jgi:hypothetical protein
MRQCIIHFGMPKTGSTSIQATLMAASPLSSATFLNVGTGNASRLLATLFLDDPKQFHLNRKWDVSAEKLARDKEEAMALLTKQFQTGKSPFILSAEVISSLDESALTRMKTWIESHVDELRLVGYVRAPKAYMESELQQKIKAGKGRIKLKNHYPDYEERFGKLEKVFGRERVDYWKFDPKAFPGNDVVRDFLQRLSLDVPEKALRRSNESLTREGLSLLYIYRKYGPGYGSGPGSVEQNRQLHLLLRQVVGSKLRLRNKVVRRILAAKAEDIRWMESRLGGSLKEVMKDDPPDAIAGEEDLLSPSRETLCWLAKQVGREADLPADGVLAPETIAEWVHELKPTSLKETKRRKQKDVSELIVAPTKPSKKVRLSALRKFISKWIARLKSRLSGKPEPGSRKKLRKLKKQRALKRQALEASNSVEAVVTLPKPAPESRIEPSVNQTAAQTIDQQPVGVVPMDGDETHTVRKVDIGSLADSVRHACPELDIKGATLRKILRPMLTRLREAVDENPAGLIVNGLGQFRTPKATRDKGDGEANHRRQFRPAGTEADRADQPGGSP